MQVVMIEIIVLLLIAPEGIEISMQVVMIEIIVLLLIAPEGIEIL